jgi:hypothetical protein
VTDPAAPTETPGVDEPSTDQFAASLAAAAFTAAYDTDGDSSEPWPPEAQPDHQPDTAGKRIRYDTKGFPHLIDGEMDQPIRWTDTH